MPPDASAGATSAHFRRADAFDSYVSASVILRSRINPSEEKTPGISRKYYRLFWPRSLTGAAFRAMTGRTVNPQVPGSSPGRGANDSGTSAPNPSCPRSCGTHLGPNHLNWPAAPPVSARYYLRLHLERTHGRQSCPPRDPSLWDPGGRRSPSISGAAAMLHWAWLRRHDDTENDRVLRAIGLTAYQSPSRRRA